jgi:hypothetical protein
VTSEVKNTSPKPRDRVIKIYDACRHPARQRITSR